MRAARGRLLVVVLAMGCTTRTINLAVDDGGTDQVSVAGEDADGASSTDFDRAYDAGAIEGFAHYVQFKCCVNTDPNNCSTERLGGPDMCNDWKYSASNKCIDLGRSLASYEFFGACTADGGP
jgi:hypothetical protein